MTATIQPFEIHVPDRELADLSRRILGTRWVDDFGNEDWLYGVEREWLREIGHYWAREFDWRAQEHAINRLPHFRIELDDIPIHFVHVRSSHADARPLLLTHGWPWTFWDWAPVIGPLTDPLAHGGSAEDAFHLVIPSLPGFGFSSPLRKSGVNFRKVADLWVRLMAQLGYPRFFAAGGDFGARVTGELAHVFPERVLGIYLTLAVLPGPVPMGTPQPFAKDEAWMADQAAAAFQSCVSHSTVHRHDPQTLAYALNDSPLGLAAWLWQRRRDWSDCAGDVVGLHGRDFLCTLASIYWHTGTIGTSMRFYLENYGERLPPVLNTGPLIPVPTAFGIAPKDVVMMPRARAAAETDLRRWTIFPRGGHFGPAEIPELLVAEFREYFHTLR